MMIMRTSIARRVPATGRGARGFTLIELMIVLIVVAILAAVAIPAYSRYSYRARRADAHNLLTNIAQAEERYYTSFNHYTDDLKNLGYSSSDDVASEHGYYTASVDFPAASASSADAYVATATPQKAQAKDACGDMTLDSAGRKTPDASDASANSNGKCW